MKLFRRFTNDIKKYFRFIVYSSKSTLKSEVANSHLGWIWWILEPLLFMLIYLFVGLVVFKKGERYYEIFVFIGLSMWNFFNKGLTNSVKTVSRNSSIIGKVYIPKYILLLSDLGQLFIKMMISFLIVAVMMVIRGVPLSINIIYFPFTIIILFIFTFGMGSIILHFGVYVEDLRNVINVGFRLLFYLSGIFYSIEQRLPKPWGKYLLWCNPAAALISCCRDALIYCKRPSFKLMFLWLAVGLILSIIGVATIYRNENSYAKVV